MGTYPWSVKQRIASRAGHLSNDALAEFLRKDYDGGAEFVILAHLSEQNNHPERARVAAEQALDRHTSLFHQRLLVATQSEVLAPVTL
jgi:phosphoribosyl 1,2-cyclic phosphodiesterase